MHPHTQFFYAIGGVGPTQLSLTYVILAALDFAIIKGNPRFINF